MDKLQFIVLYIFIHALFKCHCLKSMFMNNVTKLRFPLINLKYTLTKHYHSNIAYLMFCSINLIKVKCPKFGQNDLNFDGMIHEIFSKKDANLSWLNSFNKMNRFWSSDFRNLYFCSNTIPVWGLPLIMYASRGGGGVNTNAYKCVQGGRGV